MRTLKIDRKLSEKSPINIEIQTKLSLNNLFYIFFTKPE